MVSVDVKHHVYLLRSLSNPNDCMTSPSLTRDHIHWKRHKARLRAIRRSVMSTLSPPEAVCTQMGSGVSHCNVTLIAEDKAPSPGSVTRDFWRRKKKKKKKKLSQENRSRRIEPRPVTTSPTPCHYFDQTGTVVTVRNSRPLSRWRLRRLWTEEWQGRQMRPPLLMLKCCFTSTETVGLLGTGAQYVHLDVTELLSSVLGPSCGTHVLILARRFIFLFYPGLTLLVRPCGLCLGFDWSSCTQSTEDYIRAKRRPSRHKQIKISDSMFTLHISLCLTTIGRQTKLNEPQMHKSQRQNYWQKVKEPDNARVSLKRNGWERLKRCIVYCR